MKISSRVKSRDRGGHDVVYDLTSLEFSYVDFLGMMFTFHRHLQIFMIYVQELQNYRNLLSILDIFYIQCLLK
jgi:hypothetical protein